MNCGKILLTISVFEKMEPILPVSSIEKEC